MKRRAVVRVENAKKAASLKAEAANLRDKADAKAVQDTTFLPGSDLRIAADAATQALRDQAADKDAQAAALGG